MAYERQTWACGDTITADKLNHIEEGLEECCSGGDVGYSCEESYVTLTEEEVTTVESEGIFVGALSYSEPITADTIRVTFDGTAYICEKTDNDGDIFYGASYDEAVGAMDWSTCPFEILNLSNGNAILTEASGTYNIKIEERGFDVTTTGCFKAAVESVEPGTLHIKAASIGDEVITFDHSFADVEKAASSGKYITYDLYYDDTCQGTYPLFVNQGGLVAIVEYVVNGSSFQMTADRNYFDITPPNDPLMHSIQK